MLKAILIGAVAFLCGTQGSVGCSLFEGVYQSQAESAVAFVDPDFGFGMIMNPGDRRERVYSPNGHVNPSTGRASLVMNVAPFDSFPEPNIPDVRHPPATLIIQGASFEFRCIVLQ
jgi:hypothetical protein